MCQGNGSRNLAVLHLKKGDKVIVNTVCPLYSVANGTGERHSLERIVNSLLQMMAHLYLQCPREISPILSVVRSFFL